MNRRLSYTFRDSFLRYKSDFTRSMPPRSTSSRTERFCMWAPWAGSVVGCTAAFAILNDQGSTISESGDHYERYRHQTRLEDIHIRK